MYSDDNGILAAVAGKVIAAAGHMLPPVETATEQEASSVVDAGWLGHVRIDFARQLMRHRRHSHWAWVAVRATKVEGGVTSPIAAAIANTSSPPAYVQPDRHCRDCHWFDGMTAQGTAALCRNSACSRVRSAPETGCSLWIARGRKE